MLVSANVLKWALRAYPPLLFQRIWISEIAGDYRSAKVKVNKALITRNYNRSIFGGTLISAADPLYPALFHQLLTKRGFKIQLWLRSASIKYIKPAFYDVFFDVDISDEMMEQAEKDLTTTGKHKQEFQIDMRDKSGRLCAIVRGEIYIRNLGFSGRIDHTENESDYE